MNEDDARAWKESILGEPVTKEILVFMDDNRNVVDKELATQAQLALYGETERHEIYFRLTPKAPASPKDGR